MRVPPRMIPRVTRSPGCLPAIVSARIGKLHDGTAVDRDDDVAADGQRLTVDRRGARAAAHARPCGGRTGPDEADQDAAVDRQVDRAGDGRGELDPGDAEVGVHRPAGGDDLAGDGAGGVDRDGEADADVAARRVVRPGQDLVGDPDDVPEAVDQRAAGVAVVDGRVGLDRVVDLVAGLERVDLAALGRDDPLGDAAVLAERVADCDHGVAHPHRSHRAELEGVEQRPRRGRHIEDGDIVDPVDAEHRGAVGAALAEADRHRPGPGHDMGVREDVAAAVDHKARPECRARSARGWRSRPRLRAHPACRPGRHSDPSSSTRCWQGRLPARPGGSSWWSGR